MSKFGELIDVEVPVLLDFFTDGNEESVSMHAVLRDVAAAVGDMARVIKIDADKNKDLAAALRIKNFPTLIIYKDGEMKWRDTGLQEARELIEIVKNYI